jgi:hypothetical protein
MPVDPKPAERLKKARIAAGFETAASAARQFEWVDFIYRSHEAGRRGFDAQWAQRYGRAFGVPPEYLQFGRGPSKLRRLDVISFVGAGAEVFPIESVLERIEPPPGCPDGAFALVVRGDSMTPVYNDRDILIALWQPDARALLYARCIVDLEDGRRMVKQLAPGSTPSTFSLISHNAAPIQDVAIVRAARIIWVKPT